MLAALLAFLGSLIPASIKAWLSTRKAPETVEAEKAGQETQAAADAASAAKTEAAVAQADADAPVTQATIVTSMLNGSF